MVRVMATTSSSSVNDLQAQYPLASALECERFAAAAAAGPGKASITTTASTKLKDYLVWKQHAELMLERYDDCTCRWEQSMRAAFADFDGLTSTPRLGESLPKCAFDPILVVSDSVTTTIGGASDIAGSSGTTSNDSNHSTSTTTSEIARCEAGGPILYVLPARMDFNVLPSELYTKAIAYYCLQIYQQCNGDPCTVLIDVRAGLGWPNMFVTRMLSWLRPCCTTIYSYFPGGLRQVIVYPIPYWAIRLWRLVQPLLHADVQASIKLVSGSSTAYSAPYPCELQAYVSTTVLNKLENERIASFGKHA